MPVFIDLVTVVINSVRFLAVKRRRQKIESKGKKMKQYGYKVKEDF